jgi:Family of unknown function (DUF5996)
MAPLPAPDGSGVFVVALDMRVHDVLVEHNDGRLQRIDLTPNRSVMEVTAEVLGAVEGLVGDVEIDPTPQETPWQTPLDEDVEHTTYDPAAVAAYFRAATRAALMLAELRAPYRGRSTPVNAWWGSFDLAVTLFSGRPAEPPSDGYVLRNSMNAQEITVGWWPGDARYPRAAFFGYAHPAPEALADADVSPGRWEATLGEFVLDWDDAVAAPDPHAIALTFARSVAGHACSACEWDPELASSLESKPPPIT